MKLLPNLVSRLIWFFVIVGAVFLADYLSKEWVLDTLALGSRPLVKGLFGGVDIAFTLATNRGTAWGLFSSYPGALAFVRVVIGISLIGYYFFSKGLSSLGRFALLLILGGACGNLWDVRLRGHVIDFIDIHLWGWGYPVFNVADMAIVLGALIFLFSRK